MWSVYRWLEKSIYDEEGYLIHQGQSWYFVGSYDTIDAAANIVKQEIYLYNCTAKDGDPNPQFKILSNLK